MLGNVNAVKPRVWSQGLMNFSGEQTMRFSDQILKSIMAGSAKCFVAAVPINRAPQNWYTEFEMESELGLPDRNRQDFPREKKLLFNFLKPLRFSLSLKSKHQERQQLTS